MTMQVNDNTPSIGYISWTGVGISYKGKTYNIADGNTNLAYIYWRYSDPTSFYGGNVFPTLGPDDLLVFVNKSGTHLVVPNTTILDGSLFVPGSILANALAANSVTSEKIIAGAINATQIAAGAVGADKIAANAIISEKIAAGAIDASKIASNTITANQIAANAITSSELASNSVTAVKILAGVIDATHIKAGAIGAGQIAAGAIIADKIAAGAIDATKLSVNSLSAISANLGNVTAGNITGVNISGSTLKVTNNSTWGNGTTFVQMKDGEIFITDKNPDIVSRANANDLHIEDGAIWMVGHSANGIGQYELDLHPTHILFTEIDPVENKFVGQTKIAAGYLETRKVTADYLIANVNANIWDLTVDGPAWVHGLLGIAGMGSDILMNNYDITGVRNVITQNSSGKAVSQFEGGSIGIIDTTGSYVNFYLRPAAGGEIRVVTPTSNTSYQNIRASLVYANAVDINTGSHVYIRPIASTGEVKVTATGSTTDFRPIRARSFITDTSNRDNKKEIEIYSENTLDVFRNAQVYTYLRLNDEENAFRQLGMMIDETPRLLHGEMGDSFDLYAMTSFMGKGIKDIITVLDTHSDDNQIFKQKISQLEEEVNYLKQQIA